MKYLKEYKEFITEGNRDPKSIQKEYKDLKKQAITNLRQEWSRMNKVGNPNQLDKEGLISDILRQRHGDKYVDAAFESLTELRSDMISGTSGRRIDSLEDNKYELKKDVKGAQIGNFTNVLLPKGTIIYNLPGGVFADHFSLKNKYASRSSQGPQYFDKPTFKGIMIKQKPDILAAIEKNSKVLESLTEANRGKVFRAAKKGSYPVTLVAIDNGKVVHQELARTPEIVPAAFNVLQVIIKKKYPNAKIRVEDNTGKLLFVESVVNEGPDYSEASFQMDKIFGDDQESIEKFQDIEDNGTVEDMIDYINSWGDEDRLADYGIKSDAHVKKFAKKIMESVVNEAEKAEGDRGKMSAEIEKALKEKSTESGVPIGLLRLVMRRGLDAWNSSHRAGIPQVAWGYARVNAFLEKGKGTWGKADADIAKEVRDGGNADKLPIKNPSEFTKKEREA